MKPLETIFWLGTAGALYLAANCIAKNVAKDVLKDVFKEPVKRRDDDDYYHHNPLSWW
jgi:hypothetical protein